MGDPRVGQALRQESPPGSLASLADSLPASCRLPMGCCYVADIWAVDIVAFKTEGFEQMVQSLDAVAPAAARSLVVEPD